MNSSDMMQHQSVIYHTNSILECQILSLATIFLLAHHGEGDDPSTHEERTSS